MIIKNEWIFIKSAFIILPTIGIDWENGFTVSFTWLVLTYYISFEKSKKK